MNVGLAMLGALAVLALGYLFYSRFVAHAVGLDPDRPTPAVERNDGVDYVPTRPFVLFGHHYASIAAAGPIVGPTLALAYGYGPPLLWMLLGVVFIGAVHDFTALFVAMREGGQSIAEVCRSVFGRTGFLLFALFALMLCILVSAAFLDLAAKALTSRYPAAKLGLAPDQTLLRTELAEDGTVMARIGGVASMSVVVITLAAPLMGWLIYRRRIPTIAASLLALGLCAGSVAIGFWKPVALEPRVWATILAAYCVASGWIAVWLLLQPRDFINVHLLYIGLISMIAGLVVCGIKGVALSAPAENVAEGEHMPALGLLWPVMFVTIACGSVSGAHGLICGGTTCKQVAREAHARPIGYGGMLLETVLGVCVLLAVGTLSFDKDYRPVVHDGKNPVLGFALGVAHVLETGFGVPKAIGTVFGILTLEGFLVTTIDTVIRLSRYLVEETIRLFAPRAKFSSLRRLAITVAVAAIALALALSRGYEKIWTLFGSSNQLLAALTLTAVTAWLALHGRNFWVALVPAVFMLVTTIAALISILVKVASRGDVDWAVVGMDGVLLILAACFVAMAIGFALRRLRGRAEATP
jgi:carbon starvation protein